MNKSTPMLLALLGSALVGAAVLIKRYPLFDPLGNVDFPYLAAMLGLVALVVGVHCALFSCHPADLPLRPNLVMYVIIASAANINIVWDGIALDYPSEAIEMGLSNSLEFSVYYAAFLFLPRWSSKINRKPAGMTTAPGTQET